MMGVLNSHPFLISFTRMANNLVALSGESFWAGFAARATAINADTSRGNNSAAMGPDGISCWYLFSHL
jgi:hypothetical protein